MSDMLRDDVAGASEVRARFLCRVRALVVSRPAGEGRTVQVPVVSAQDSVARYRGANIERPPRFRGRPPVFLRPCARL